ncbi:MAG: DUF2163 domain-containing protein [Gammaproteobacteria bacterium]
MKALTGTATTHLAGEVTTLCMCWRITRADGIVLGFTDYHEDLVIAGLTYMAQSGMVRATALTGTSDLGVDNADVETVLDSATIDREDMEAGRYDFAEIRIFLTDYLNPTDWDVKLLRGTIGEVVVGKHAGRAELRSLTQRLKQRIGRSHEVSCPYELGSPKCGVNLALFTRTGTVTATTPSNARFIDTARTEIARWFRGGKLTWTSGDNNGLSMEVAMNNPTGNIMRLMLAMPFQIALGDAYSVHAGCDKTYATCKAKFNNFNFGGFTFIPGSDFQLSFPDHRGS